MEKISCGHVTPALRKPKKKKQVKDELDRLKQAERKKRRLEKALATSAAIRSELEKKKQKKKEEQQRLDEEGAAIAEAVALHVLGDDSDDPCRVVNENRNFDDWKYSGDIGIFMGFESLKMHEGQNLFSSIYGGQYDDWGIGMPLKNGMHGISLQVPCLEVKSHTAELSAGLIAAQALSSLRIADDSQNGKFISEKGTATAVLNRMLEGGGFDNEDTFCENQWAT